MRGEGTLVVRARREKSWVVVEIEDNPFSPRLARGEWALRIEALDVPEGMLPEVRRAVSSAATIAAVSRIIMARSDMKRNVVFIMLFCSAQSAIYCSWRKCNNYGW
mgnify:CR=1 FL=1